MNENEIKTLNQQAQVKEKKFQSNSLSLQQSLVSQIMKKHKEKQKQFQEKQDKIFIEEQVDKKFPKPNVTPVVKQKLTFDKITKQILDDPKVNNQQKAQLLISDLAQKIDNKEFKEKKRIDPTSKQDFTVRIGVGVQTKLQEIARIQQLDTLAINKKLFSNQQQAQKDDQQKQIDNMLKEKQSKVNQELKRKQEKINYAVTKKPEIQENIQVLENKIEKQKQNEVQRKYLFENLRQLAQDNQGLKEAIQRSNLQIEQLDERIKILKRTTKAIDIGGKFQNIKLQKQIEASSQDVSTEQSQILIKDILEYGQIQNLNDPDITLIVASKIAEKGLSLKDVYNMLDDDADGVLTMNEILENMPKLNLNINEDNIKKFIEIIDKNSDGVLNEQEFIGYLTSGVQVQQEFITIMGNLKNLLNPIKLEDNQIQQIKQLEQKVQFIKGSSMDKVQELKELKSEADNLRKNLRENQEQKQKIINSMNDKKELIDENIGKLTLDLTYKSSIVLESKQQLRELQISQQTLELRILSFQSIAEKIQIQLSQKTSKEQDIMQKQMNNQISKLKNIAEGQNRQVQVDQMKFLYIKMQQAAQGILMIQKCIRGKITRRRLQKKLEKITQGYQIFQKKIYPKIKMCQDEIMNLFSICLQKWKSEDKIRQEERKMAMFQQRKQINKEEYKLSSKSTLLQNLIELFKSSPIMLPAAISIQKAFRRLIKQLPETQKVYDIGYGSLEEKCSFCQSDMLDVICRQ